MFCLLYWRRQVFRDRRYQESEKKRLEPGLRREALHAEVFWSRAHQPTGGYVGVGKGVQGAVEGVGFVRAG
jgi:hypothetical protein